jgi:NO-binding membrane sensor protein with MHYT domain
VNLIGIPLRKPAFSEFTAATVMAVGLWAAAVVLLLAARVGIDRTDAGGLLVALLWACLSTRMGIRVGQDRRHLAANLLGCGLLLGAYQVLVLLVG